MEESLLKSKRYLFDGELKNLKHKLKNFRTVKVVTNTCVNGVVLYSAECEFEYNNKIIKVLVSKDFAGNKKVFLELLGVKDES